MVEELQVRGWVASQAEVAGSGDQPLAEVPVPDAVDDDPGGERVLRVDDRLGQLEPAAPLPKRPPFGTGQHFEELSRYGLAWPAGIAPHEDSRVDRPWRIMHHH